MPKLLDKFLSFLKLKEKEKQTRPITISDMADIDIINLYQDYSYQCAHLSKELMNRNVSRSVSVLVWDIEDELYDIEDLITMSMSRSEKFEDYVAAENYRRQIERIKNLQANVRKMKAGRLIKIID